MLSYNWARVRKSCLEEKGRVSHWNLQLGEWPGLWMGVTAPFRSHDLPLVDFLEEWKKKQVAGTEAQGRQWIEMGGEPL